MIQGNIEEMLETEGLYICTTVGTSMAPFFKERRDNALIRPVTQELKKYDVVLYKRNDKYILHRIIKLTEDGLVIRGDNCFNKEYDIKEPIGILAGAWRKEKYIGTDDFSYKVYSRFIVFVHPVYMMYRRAVNLLRRIKRKVCKQ